MFNGVFLLGMLGEVVGGSHLDLSSSGETKKMQKRKAIDRMLHATQANVSVGIFSDFDSTVVAASDGASGHRTSGC